MTDPAPRRLRLLPAPDPEPPYDDERAPAVPLVHGSLALAFPVERPAVPLRLVPPAVPGSGECPDTPPLPEPRGWTGRLTQVLAEILAGARPAAQLARFASLDVLDQLERPSSWRARRPGQPPVRPVVRHVRIDQPAPGVVEGCAVVDTGGRRRALAVRLEGIDGRWQCTAVQTG